MMIDDTYIETALTAGDQAESSKQIEKIIEFIKTPPKPGRTDHFIENIACIAGLKERKLEVRFRAVDMLHKIGRDDAMGKAWSYLHIISNDTSEPLRLRWAAVDALRVIKPEDVENMEKLPDMDDLFYRAVDPDNPPPRLSYHDGLAKIAEKQSRTMFIYPLIALFIFGGIMGTYFSYGKWFFQLIIAGWIVLVTGFIALSLVFARRCPNCKRFFARQSLKYAGSYNTPARPIGSLGPGGSPVQVSQRVDAYKVRCRYCHHPWFVLR
ncbi:MAG: hypothetical protein MUD12_06630 [Spirochaetes bacterium]|jgi:hypothetical protein|nr:hypothetical protein [Spirochaetota bacterium]